MTSASSDGHSGSWSQGPLQTWNCEHRYFLRFKKDPVNETCLQQLRWGRGSMCTVAFAIALQTCVAIPDRLITNLHLWWTQWCGRKPDKALNSPCPHNPHRQHCQVLSKCKQECTSNNTPISCVLSGIKFSVKASKIMHLARSSLVNTSPHYSRLTPVPHSVLALHTAHDWSVQELGLDTIYV